jgi:hypothetical protein
MQEERKNLAKAINKGLQPLVADIKNDYSTIPI